MSLRSTFLWLTLCSAVSLPSLANAQVSPSGLVSSRAANRLGLERKWFTQASVDRAIGRVQAITTHISNKRQLTLVQILTEYGRVDISEREIDSFGRPLGKIGAIKKAARQILDICLAKQKQSPADADLTNLTKTEQAAQQVLQNIIDLEDRWAARPVAAADEQEGALDDTPIDDYAVPLLRQAKAAPDELPQMKVRVVPEVTIYVATDQGVVQAIDGETGKSKWKRPIGRAGHPNLAPAANDDILAMVNGSKLILVESSTGKPLWERQLKGSPGAGPAITEDSVFVPMVSGHVESYKLYNIDQEFQPARYFVSIGRAMVQPITSSTGTLCWPTDRGFLYFADGDSMRLKFRLEANKTIVAPAAYQDPGLFFATSVDGYAYCIKESTGAVLWRYSTGQPIENAPVAIGDTVYVITNDNGLFAVNTADGQEKWWSPRVRQFLAASESRLYCEGIRGQIVVLDAKSGGFIGSIETPGLDLKLTNVLSDRIYIGTKTGLIQCLHESQLDLPLVHAAVEPEQVKRKSRPKATTPTPAPDGGAKDPFATGGAKDPFGGSGAKDPFGGSGTKDPFGGSGGGTKDPFGGSGGGADPKDPFGGSGGGADPKDPFGGAGATDPFGN